MSEKNADRTGSVWITPAEKHKRERGRCLWDAGLTDRRTWVWQLRLNEIQQDRPGHTGDCTRGGGGVLQKNAHTHITLQPSAKTSVPRCVCVCWQRQTVILLPAAQPLEGKRQTLRPIYSNTARHLLYNNASAVLSGFKSVCLSLCTHTASMCVSMIKCSPLVFISM